MAKGKYQDLIKPLKIAASPPGQVSPFKNTGNADSIRWLNGRDHLNGVKLNFSWGFYTGLGYWHPGIDPHVHPYPECLVFVGLDPARQQHLGAKIQFCTGKELEVHTFDKPTTVIAPGGFVHCPLSTLDVSDPTGYSFFIISLGAEPTTAWLGDGLTDAQIKERQAREALALKNGRSPTMQSSYPSKRVHVSPETLTYGHLYDKYFKSMLPNTPAVRRLNKDQKSNYSEMVQSGRKAGPGAAPNTVWQFGSDLEGLDLNFSWGIHTSPGLWLRGGGAHTHPVDEVLVLAGTDPSDIDYLGAEVQIDIGPDHERYVIDQPSAIIFPAGLPHSPIVTRWVDRPFGCLMMSLGSQHITEYVD